MKDRMNRMGLWLGAGMLGLALTATAARGDSAAGFFRAEAPSNGTVLVSIPFHPFAEGRLDDVLRGTLAPGVIPGEGADASLWIAEAQAMTNAWLQAPGEDGAPRWVTGNDPADATPFDLPLSAGDALFIRNLQPAPAHVFLSGLVPFDPDCPAAVQPGLNLLSSGFPFDMPATNAAFEGMRPFLRLWDAAGQSYAAVSNGLVPWTAGFWAERTATNAVEWVRPSPFPGGLARDGMAPGIAGLDLDPAAPSASLVLSSTPGAEVPIDILARTPSQDAAFSLSGWSHADRVGSQGAARLVWRDPALDAPDALFGTSGRFYLVGDAAVDSDEDGLSDVLERHVYGTDPLDADTDGDGVADGVEIARSSLPLVPDAPAVYAFFEGFEADTVSPGDLDGQNGWSVSLPGAATVQTNHAFEGSASLKILSSGTNEDVKVARAFTNAPQIVWMDWRQVAGFSSEEPPIPEEAAVALFFNAKGRPVVLDGSLAPSSMWRVLGDAPAVEEDAWIRCTVRLDYGSRTWDFYLDGVLVAEGIGLGSDAPAALSEVEIQGRHGAYDSIRLDSRRPGGLSSDGDALPDDWEVAHFGSLGQDGDADPDGDGLANAAEHRLGTDPLASDSDADTMPDGWEAAHGFDPLDPADADLDRDGDGLANAVEQALGTDPDVFELDPRTRLPGLRAEFHATPGYLTAMPDFDALLIRDLLVATRVDFASATGAWEHVDASLKDDFACRMTGFLQVLVPGTYTFHLASDAGAVLAIDGAAVVADGAAHTLRTRSGSVALAKGFHALAIDYYDTTGAAVLKLEWEASAAALPRAVVPASALWHLPFTNEPPCAVLAAEDTRYVEGNAIPLTVDAWDVDGAVAEVRILADGATIFATNAPAAAFVWTNAPAGAHELVALAIDAEGASAPSATVLVAVAEPPAGYEVGLSAAFYDFATGLSAFPDLAAATTARVSRVDARIDYPDTTAPWPGLPDCMADTFASVHDGYLFVPQSGLYTLGLASDDGAQLWLDGALAIDNGGLHAMSEKTATLPLAQGLHPIAVKYFENGGSAGLVLRWTGPGIARQVVPARAFFRKTGVSDTDGDGIEDWWETLHGLDPADPADGALDSDGDGLSNLDEFLAGTNPIDPDTDGDGIPDAWELQNGLIPYVADAVPDTDGDGLSNYEEYLAGTSPNLADTDGDGLDDFQELRIAHTNPLVVDIDGAAPVQVGDAVAGSLATATSGSWGVDGDTLFARERAGSATYTLTVPTPAPSALAVTVEQYNALTVQSAFDIALAIDGVFIARCVTDAPRGSPRDALFFLPALEPGPHTFKITWHNWRANTFLAIRGLRFLVYDGPDTDENGLADWIDNRAAAATTVEDLPLTSLVSPLCVEGADFWRDVLHVSAQHPTNTVVLPVIPTIGEGFYVDVPLDPEGQSVVVSLDDRGDHTFPVAWEALDILANDFAQDALAIRRGDALRLAGSNGLDTAVAIYRAEGTNAWLAVTNFTATAAVPYAFETEGAYLVEAVCASNPACVGFARIDVTESAFAAPRPAVSMGLPRTWPCPRLDPEAVLEHDAALDVSAAPLDNGGVALTLTAVKDRLHGLVSRLGDDGPVLDAAQVQPVWGDNGSYYHVLSNYADGSQLVEVVLRLGAIPDGLSVKLEIFVAGVFFEDGTRVKTLTAADFDENGCVRLRFLRAANITTSVCHRTYIYQDGVEIYNNR